MKRTTALAVLTSLSLTGCSLLSSPTPPIFETPQPTATVHTEKATIEDSSIERSPQPKPSASSQKTTEELPARTMPYASVEDYWSVTPSREDGIYFSIPEPHDPADYDLSPEEKDAVAQGKYVKATDKHPAFNVPEPEFPEALRQGGRAEEMAVEFIKYWSDTYRYLEYTGQDDFLVAVTEVPNDSLTTPLIASATNSNEGSWMVGCDTQFEPLTENAVVGTDGTTVHVFTPVVMSGKECTITNGKEKRTMGAGSQRLVLWTQFDSVTRKHWMIGAVEATGRYYELPREVKKLVCTFSPGECPQDVYDKLREELQGSATIPAEKKNS